MSLSVFTRRLAIFDGRDWTPTDAGAQLAGWWYAGAGAGDLSKVWTDSARTTQATATSDPIGALDDRSGNGRNLLQSTSGARPTVDVAGYRGHNLITLDGADDFLQSATFGAALAQPVWIGVSFLYTTATVGRYLWDGSASDRQAAFSGNNGGGQHRVIRGFAGSTLSGENGSNFGTGVWHVGSIFYNGASSQIYFDGVLLTTGDTGAGSLGRMTLGAANDGTNTLNGCFGEAIVLTNPSAALRATARAYLVERWV